MPNVPKDTDTRIECDGGCNHAEEGIACTAWSNPPMQTEATLRVYYDGSTYVVASDMDDAQANFEGWAHYKPEDLTETNEQDELAIWWDLAKRRASEPNYECVRRITLTMGEWVEVNGRGFLCSEDY